MLEIATDGCCKGHPCDNCKTCQSGRCCRRDNPDYKLPELGEWDGPIYGELGVLNDDGEKVECHCCGEWFVGLALHVWQIHDLTAREYKSIFGLRLTYSLLSPVVHERRAQQLVGSVAALMRENRETNRISPVVALTTEQRSHLMSKPKALQVRKLPSHQERWAHNIEKMRDTASANQRAQTHCKRGHLLSGDNLRVNKRGYRVCRQCERQRQRVARELYGDKARLNFPEG